MNHVRKLTFPMVSASGACGPCSLSPIPPLGGWLGKGGALLRFGIVHSVVGEGQGDRLGPVAG
jgi:hypothetical protein